MVKIESKKVEIKRNVEFVYEYLADFTHFSMVANDKIENFKATQDRCSFTIKGMTDMGLKIISRLPNESITISNDTDVPSSMPLNFLIIFEFERVEPYVTKVIVKMELDANPMIAMMVKKPLEKFVNSLADGMKTAMETMI
ncbi:MAG: hypothetical protein UHE91_02915 [Bacteroidales bacterium]|jgi:hypothetical protein|nr:hypothetical protein [Bacteroidales bacterium]MEE0889690.1 hypothetical protein [Bacteroidales bacterium]MEE1142862.1 hypothetical protein [Bacteroidales bacterium]MEE1272296.1 hypothetical protein [Bacteroidales bacterium]MEE1322751.1 hypothetical protein [Bacteroidales bacterium]